MIADGDADELEVAVFLDGRDGGEIGGAAADIDDEEDIARADLLAPGLACGVDPGVEGGLGLFEEGEVLEARGVRGFDGEVARGRVTLESKGI